MVEYVLSEGKADSFANILIPNFKVPWTKELSLEGVNTIWNWIKERRYSFNETDLGEIRNGNREIPQWSEYRIGYHIMQEFLKNNPNVTLEEWTLMELDNVQVQQWLTYISATRGMDGLDDGFEQAATYAASFYENLKNLKQLYPQETQWYEETKASFDRYYEMGQKMTNEYIATDGLALRDPSRCRYSSVSIMG